MSERGKRDVMKAAGIDFIYKFTPRFAGYPNFEFVFIQTIQ
jgi:hypothetical protein